jgi:peptide/nickel transport system permease protein
MTESGMTEPGMTDPVAAAPPTTAAVTSTVAGLDTPRSGLIRGAMRLWRTRIGVLFTAVIVLIALIGPFVSPNDPAAFVATPYATSGPGLPFGADHLGQDVLSRFLNGGRSILLLSVLATLLGVGGGVLVGLISAYARNALDDILMRSMDVVLAFPQLMLALVAMATVGPKWWLIVLTVGLTTLPRVARVIRGAAVPVVERDFVAASEALAEPRIQILLRDVLPNVTGPLVVETTLRLTYAVGLIASLAFLGFAANPNAADWGLMIQENAAALTVQPWGTLLPVIAIAVLTVGTGLIGDGLARASSGIDRGRD